MTNELTKPKTRKKRRPYPPKYRAARAELIRRTRPDKQSTGPRSPAGKAASSRNALKGGARSALFTELRRVLRLQREYVAALQAGRGR